MKILLKLTVSNMLKKPFRSFILIFCMTLTAFCAGMAIDMQDYLESSIKSVFYAERGTCDIELSNDKGIKDDFFEGVPEYNSFTYYCNAEKMYQREKEYYSYVFSENAVIYGMDIQKAYEMEFLNEEFVLLDDEIVINELYAERLSCKEGSVIELHDVIGDTVPFKVKKILKPYGKFISSAVCSAVVNENAMKILQGSETLNSDILLIDVLDNSKIDEFADKLKENAPLADIFVYDDLEEDDTLKKIFLFLFIFVFLLVIFVTVSFSNRIVSERMSVIGTLRSIGISGKITAFILLLENIIYGLAGAGSGMAVYAAVRKKILNMAVSMFDLTVPEYEPSVMPVVLTVFVGVLLVECICPVSALVKALKRPIRDIIYDNNDTEYRYSSNQMLAGILLLITGLVLSFVGRNNMYVLVISLLSFVASLALLMPLILKIVSKIMETICIKTNHPVAKLASAEICTKKSTVGSAILCVTTVCVTIAIAGISVSEISDFGKTGYNADVLIINPANEESVLSFINDIEGVSGTEYIYEIDDYIEINKESQDQIVTVRALPDKNYYDLIPDLPDSLKENEFLMSRKDADKHGIKIGDTVDFTLCANELFPSQVQLTLSAYIDTRKESTFSEYYIINEKLFSEVYSKDPSTVLVRCSDPEGTLKNIKDHLISDSAEYYTADSYKQKMVRVYAGFLAVFAGIIVLGLSLTMIGTSGNQIIGFEGRKREYAVMMSTSLNRRQLVKLIFLENVFSTGAAVVTAVVSSVFTLKLVSLIMESINEGISETAIPAFIIPLSGFAMWLILMLTCIKPIKSLKKMNIASELKYE